MNSYKKIVIVGGGTAGWSAAALLSTIKGIELSIIEPTDDNIIGVGESTLPHINKFHAEAGLNLLSMDWLDEVDGTLKFSIEFDKFTSKGKWIHPFFSATGSDESTIRNISTNKLEIGESETQSDFVTNHFSLANRKNKKFYSLEDSKKDPILSSVGYHLDSIKYGRVIKKRVLEHRDVSFFDKKIVNIKTNDSKIEEIVLSDGTKIFADLFIDCTGFRSVLMNETDSKWMSFDDRLFCNRSIATQLPYLNKDNQQKNTTYCHALSSGWVWNVPLQSRIGTGYVFSDKYLDDEQATHEFKSHLVNIYGYNYNEINTRVVPFRVGMWDKGWNKNVVSIGLSSFFIEPLESTGIALFHSELMQLKQLLLMNIPNKRKIKNYNMYYNHSILDTLEFVEMHYSLTDRTDTKFWKDYNNHPLSEYQKEMLRQHTSKDVIFDRKSMADFNMRHSFFSSESYTLMFLGYGILPNSN